jgi:hypothetical protein
MGHQLPKPQDAPQGRDGLRDHDTVNVVGWPTDVVLQWRHQLRL